MIAADLSSLPRRLQYRCLSGKYVILKRPSSDDVPDWALTSGQFCSVTRTDNELSIVCAIPEEAQEVLPTGGTPALPRWICLKLEGPFAFTETGILSSFIGPLSAESIPIFAVSTFDTDYVLIPEEHWGAASDVLRKAGHQLVSLDC